MHIIMRWKKKRQTSKANKGKTHSFYIFCNYSDNLRKGILSITHIFYIVYYKNERLKKCLYKLIV